MKKQLILLSLLSLLSATILCAAAQDKPIVIGQAIDFLDNAFYTEKEFYTQAELRRRLELAYAGGVRRVYFRGTGGVTYYPSSVRRMYTGSHSDEYAKKLYDTIHSYDVVAEYIKVCHELGMELYYWDPIFDTSLYSKNYPGMEAYALYGAQPCRDFSINPEHCLQHRLAVSRPRENLHGTIGELRLHLAQAPKGIVTAGKLRIYTAPHDHDFQPYTAPYDVHMEGNDIIISGLYVYNPVVKLAFEDDFYLVTDLMDGDAATATYTSGEPVKLFTACEVVLDGDTDPVRVRHGSSGYLCGWGDAAAKRTLIVRFGDFERNAIGVPEYAFRENRLRMEKIVGELYDRYPELDGVAFSIRTHSLPSGGSPDKVGGKLCYGFSEPVVEEYRRRYGTDPTAEDYDVDAFLKLRGEYFTQMLDGVAKIIHAHGGKFAVMAPVNARKVGPYNHGSMYPWLEHYSIDNYFDIETWARRGIVDSVMMLGTGHRQRDWTQGWKDEVKAFKAKLAGTDTRLTLHFLVNDDAGQENCQPLLDEVLREGDIDEVEFYEEFTMAVCGKYPVLMEALKKAGRPHTPSRWTK